MPNSNSEFFIKIEQNEDIVKKLIIQDLTTKDKKMMEDLIEKDPNYCSILNHALQKFHRFHLKIN